MHPIFLELGSITIRWYGVMAALGFLAATILINVNRKYAKMTADQATSLVFISVICGILGARLFYVIQFWEKFRNNFWEIFRIDHGGLVFYGGFFLAMIGIAVYCRKQKLSIIRVMDIMCPALAVGHAMGRIGCFLNGCCYGKPTECALGVIYPQGTDPHFRYGNIPLHPVQLYETAANIILAVLLFFLVRKTRRGFTMASYMILYGVLRFLDEFFRGDHRNLWLDGMLTPAQVIGLALVPVGTMLLIFFIKKNGKETSQPDN
jgi:phosphatidylglycerol:prolipoprotein diacylglycerol transferase